MYIYIYNYNMSGISITIKHKLASRNHDDPPSLCPPLMVSAIEGPLKPPNHQINIITPIASKGTLI